jgi:hypothetical protein
MTIRQEVLSNALKTAIAGRRVKAAVFLTFEFDPGFFEEEILPLLFVQSFSHMPRVRIVQLEEALRSIEHVAVYYDRRGLLQSAQPASLDYRRIALGRSTGFFHPKNVMLLLENHEKEETWDSLLLATLSANLTQSGWWRNIEVADLEEVHAGEKCAFREQILELIARLKREDHTGEEHAALEVFRQFVARRIESSTWHKKQSRWLPHLYVGQESVPGFLSLFVHEETFNLEVISPYFDDDDSASVLNELIDTLQPRETRLYLPRDDSGAALCRPGLFEAIKDKARVRWAKLPQSMATSASTGQGGEAERFVHAKVYRFWNQSRAIYFVGSVNLTNPAHSPGRAGNFETGILVEPEPDSRLTWWLEPLSEQEQPAKFKPEGAVETETEAPTIPAAFRYDWNTQQLDYFWEGRTESRPQSARVSANGVFLFDLEAINLDGWIALPHDDAQAVGTVLKSTSFLEISVDGGPPGRVLVREENMAHKPSILLTFSAEEILQYWSLLSPEQREAVLATRLQEEADGLRLTVPGLAEVDSMFKHFAGIFHAFNQLEQHVHAAIQKKHEADAVYRLFGEKYDSLPSLIKRVVEEIDTDLVNRYVTLLCAQQVLKRIGRDAADFKERYRHDFGRVQDLLADALTLKEGFTFDDEAERQKFFAWFEKMFFMEIPLPEVDQ